MDFKYAEVFIIRNIEEENIFRSIFRYIGYENISNENDIIIIKFDEETIYDTKVEYIDKKYMFGIKSMEHIFPIYFKFKTDKEYTLYYKNPVEKNGVKKLDFKHIFINYKLFCNQKLQPSIYNTIYEDVFKKEKFAIVRINSNEEKPRFILAYDNCFTKSDIIYLVDNIFKQKF